MIVAGILAAGGSTRMRGRDKLTELVGGEPLLARQIRIAQEAGLPVLVALPPGGTRAATTSAQAAAAGARTTTTGPTRAGVARGAGELPRIPAAQGDVPGADARVAATRPPQADVAPGGGERARIVAASGATPVEVPDAARGMGRSIAALATAAERADADALLLLLGDMPELEAEDLRRLTAAAAPGMVVRAATADGRPGHPVLFPRALFAALRELDGDLGARAVIAAAEVRLVPLPGTRAATDLDTPEAWAAWRATRGES